MAAGIPVDKFSIDQQVGSLARSIEQFANQALQLKQQMDARPDADLVELGYTEDDVALLKSAAADMATVAGVYKGTIDHTPASDLGVFSRRLMGLYLGG